MANQKKYGNKISWADLFILVEMLLLDLWVSKLLVLVVEEKIFGNQRKIYWGSEKNGLQIIDIIQRELENPLEQSKWV